MPRPIFPFLEAPAHLFTRRTLMGATTALLAGVSLRHARAQDATPRAFASPVALPGESLPYLFIQTADRGSWQPMRGQPGAFLLTLDGVSPQTIVIRDQPTNASGAIPTSDLFEAIRFSADVPLQGVVSVESSTGQDVLVVSFSRATYDPAAEKLVYVATKLDDFIDMHGIEPLQSQKGNFTLPSDFGATTLFISNAYCRDDLADSCQFD